MGTLDEMATKLRAPFPPDRIEWRAAQETKDGSKIMVLAYLTSRAVMERLDEVFGPFGWSTKYESGPSGGVVCNLSVRNPDSGEWVSKADGADNTDFEAVKGGLSGALKRAAVHWGIGRYLYDLPSTWVPLKDRGENWHRSKNLNGQSRYWDTPGLPSWALPKNDSGQKSSEVQIEMLMAIDGCEELIDLEDLGVIIAKDNTLTKVQRDRLRDAYARKMSALKKGE